MCVPRIRLKIHINNKKNCTSFLVESENFLLVHRNRYSEVMDNGQKTPLGHLDINSYVKNLRVLVFITDKQRDR